MTRFAVPESVMLLRQRTSFIPVPATLAKLRGVTRREALDVSRSMSAIARELRIEAWACACGLHVQTDWRNDASRYLRYAREYRTLASEL